MSCNCQSGLSCGCGLGDGRAMPYQLSNAQVASFLLRHPVTAFEIGETQAAIDSGVYDWDYVGLWRFPGLIPPYGVQVDDSQYGMVTVQIGTDGQAHYAANSYDLGTDKPDYISDSGNSLDQITSDVTSALKSTGLLIAAAVVGYALISRKSK